MGFACGIVGLPNVGKSTLFNALTASADAQAANFPFCTIEPNTGRVAVPDQRLISLSQLAQSQRIIPTYLDFVDIAGLVRGASQGEGLGNRFLSHIRQMDAIAHVVRCFEGDDVTHVDGHVSPVRDIDTVETEMMLADLDTLEKRHDTLTKKARGGESESKQLLALIDPVLAALREGRPARNVPVAEGDQLLFDQLRLLSAKPVLYICNIDEADAAQGNALSTEVMERAQAENAACVSVSASVESEIAMLADQEEQQAFLESMGLQETGLDRVIRCGYGLLDLITFFTCGPKETRAWTCRRHTLAPAAAGKIHGDFERGFICAEIIAYQDYITAGGENAARDKGLMRREGRDYPIQDGDVALFRFNV